MHDLQKGSISWLLFIHQSQYDYENIFSRLKFWFYLKKEKENLYCIYIGWYLIFAMHIFWIYNPKPRELLQVL